MYKHLIAACLAAATVAARADLLAELAAADLAADGAVAAISTPAELSARQSAWRKAWIDGLGGLPERTPLNARVASVVSCDGFRMENILFESQPGVYVTAHLALPDKSAFNPPYPAVLMPLGHSDNSILYPHYAAHLAMTARAGFAVLTWDSDFSGRAAPGCAALRLQRQLLHRTRPHRRPRLAGGLEFRAFSHLGWDESARLSRNAQRR